MKNTLIIGGVIILLAIGGRVFWVYQQVKSGEQQVTAQPIVVKNIQNPNLVSVVATSTLVRVSATATNQCIRIKTNYTGDVIKEICDGQEWSKGAKGEPSVTSEFYVDHGKLWFVKGYKPGESILIGEAVDTQTLLSEFSILSLTGDSMYYVFHGQVYFNDKIILGADPKTFIVIGIGEYNSFPGMTAVLQTLNYSKDSAHVYYKGVLIPRGDPVTISVIVTGLANHEYAKDKTYVYYHGDEIVGADPASFASFLSPGYEGGGDGPYGIDHTHVFFEANLLPEADRGTFNMHIGDYASDKTHVFFKGQIIPGADPKTFVYPVPMIG